MWRKGWESVGGECGKVWGGVGKCVGEMRCVGKCGVGAGKCVGVRGEVKRGVGSVLRCGKCVEVWVKVR